MSENNCAVYVHINLINGKKYFGITTQNPPEKRWANGNGYYNNAHFMSAVRKYGWDNFAHFVLYKNIPIKIAENIEEMLIREHMSHDPRFGYNKTMGGELERHTKETREKISKNNGMKRPEIVEKSAAAHRKPVEALDLETGRVVHRFKSTRDAGRAGFDPSHVVKCCQRKYKTHAGYIWRYVEEVSDNDSDN